MANYDDNNIFAKIIRGEIDGDKVYEDEKVLAIKDLYPAAPVHILVLPKGRYISFDDFVLSATGEEVAGFYRRVREIAAEQGVVETGYRLIANHGDNASQTIPHFHVHILGGRALGGLVPNDILSR